MSEQNRMPGIAQSEWLCPACGHMIDTPMHELGCHSGCSCRGLGVGWMVQPCGAGCRRRFVWTGARWEARDAR